MSTILYVNIANPPAVFLVSWLAAMIVGYTLRKMAGLSRLCFFIISLFIFCNIAVFSVSAGGATLVLLDSLTIRETHSIFFKSLQGTDHRIACKPCLTV